MVSAGQDAGTGAGPPFEALNAGGTAPLLLLCDHASQLIPSDLDSLGLDEALAFSCARSGRWLALRVCRATNH